MKREKNHFLRGLIITVLVFAVLLGGSYALIENVSSRASEAETELVKGAVRTAVVTCYAVEGAYPTDIEYLKTRYGLSYDEERYQVVYDAFACNLMPDISVLEKGVAP